MKYKREVFILFLAITLLVVSAFFYSYSTQDTLKAEAQVASMSLSASNYPYRGYGIASLATGAILMTTGAISFTRRSEKGFENLFVLAKNKADEQPN